MRDQKRTPVLAHLRFAADQDAYNGLTLAQTFARIQDTNLWGASESVSGLGSELGATTTLRLALPGLLAELGAASLLDAPCGDAGWISRMQLGVRYAGIDIVPAVVSQAKQHRSSLDFIIGDITQDELPRADVILCRDCLVHLSFANIERALANFNRSGARWLITTTFPAWQANFDCKDGDWRALNFERPPFGWPPPISLLNEGCTEANGGWRDKSLGVWPLSSA